MAFCTVSCWEVHLPTANHREAWAIEEAAPASGSYVEDTNRETAAARRAPVRRRSPSPAPKTNEPQQGVTKSSEPDPKAEAMEKEILVVVSRMKEYIRWKSGFNTSDRAAGPLSDIVRKACDEAIRVAERDERKTVLDRDVPKPR